MPSPILKAMTTAPTHTREWLGRVRPDQRQAHEQFLVWLNGDEAKRVIARLPLSEYRLEQRGDDLKITMTATEPTGFVRFLRFDRFWPNFWEYVGGERPALPLPAPESLGPVLRVHWRRAAGESHDANPAR
jgi:hypothetical protein